MGAFVTRCFWIEERNRGRSNLARWTTNVPVTGATSIAMIEPSGDKWRSVFNSSSFFLRFVSAHVQSFGRDTLQRRERLTDMIHRKERNHSRVGVSKLAGRADDLENVGDDISVAQHSSLGLQHHSVDQ